MRFECLPFGEAWPFYSQKKKKKRIFDSLQDPAYTRGQSLIIACISKPLDWFVSITQDNSIGRFPFVYPSYLKCVRKYDERLR